MQIERTDVVLFFPRMCRNDSILDISSEMLYAFKCFLSSFCLSLCLLSFPPPVSSSLIYFLFSVVFFLRQGLPTLPRLLWNCLLCLSVCVGWCCSRRRLSRNRVILTGFFSSALLLVSTRNIRLAATLSRPGRWPCVLHVLHGFSNEIISI